MKKILGAGVLLSLCACGAPAAPPVPRPVPEQSICGTIEDPIRVEQARCDSGDPLVRVYSADPNELDFDDYTPLGGDVDDDYLNGEDRAYVAPRRSTPRATTPRTSTPRATPAPRTTVRPSVAAPAPRQTQPPRRPSTTRRTR